MRLAREAGDRYFDPSTRRCLIVRDTCWYAISLLFDDTEARRRLGDELLLSAHAEDATHTPATFLALLHRIAERITPDVSAHLEQEVRSALVEAAATEWHDGNVNHPLGAYCTLILGGERFGQSWAVDLGLRRLAAFRERIGDHRSRYRRQAEMSEYNSPTYTALNLWFLALTAEHASRPEARRLALFLEQRLWINVAMHFHAPSMQFAGPHSRSYQEDSLGGFSALHCTMLAAFDTPLFLSPELCYRYNHPSSLIENALVALLPFHVPEEARTIAWQKPFPYSFRMTTYGERYHENSRRGTSPGGDPVCLQIHGEPSRPSDGTLPESGLFAFDDEVYPGGWSELTTFLTEEYALGSASLPYVNAGHSDSVILRIRRASPVSRMADIRALTTRGVFNGARIGEKNFCHVAQTPIDESYLYEEGRSATYQHENTIIVCYSPKRAGHSDVRSFRLDLIISHAAPLDALVVDGRPVEAFPARFGAGVRICFRDFNTFGLIVPLPPVPSPSTTPVVLWRCGEFLVLSIYNYDGVMRSFSRHEINGWRTGFALEIATSHELSWEDFVDRAAATRASETVEHGTVRSVRYASGEHRMEFSYDPFKEVILSRRWDGKDDCVEYLLVSAAGQTTGPFCPPTLYGSEVFL